MQSDAPVQFGYAVVARQANQPLPEPIPGKSLGFVASNDPSYCVVAKGDVDGDGTFQYVVGHSFNSELHIENEGE